MDSLDSHIIRTIAYFDLLNRPLVALEIFKWLQFQTSCYDLITSLDQLVVAGKIETLHGYYFLPKRSSILDQRARSYVVSIGKLRKARSYGRLLLVLPWVRQLAVYNSVAFFTARPESHIDLFIVTAPGRVWSARFFINTVLKFLHARPTRMNKSNKICISYLRDTQHLETEDIARSWSELYPIYHHGQYIFIGGDSTEFFNRNTWLQHLLPQWYRYSPNWRLMVSGFTWAQSFFELLISVIPERVWQRLQLKILPRHYRTTINYPQDQITGEGIIKLHTTKVRIDFDAKYHALLASLNS